MDENINILQFLEELKQDSIFRYPERLLEQIAVFINILPQDEKCNGEDIMRRLLEIHYENKELDTQHDKLLRSKFSSEYQLNASKNSLSKYRNFFQSKGWCDVYYLKEINFFTKKIENTKEIMENINEKRDILEKERNLLSNQFILISEM
jgi:hypothetical protein